MMVPREMPWRKTRCASFISAHHSVITDGIDVVRTMPTIREIGPAFDSQTRALNPAVFWQKYDNGDYN